MRKIAYLCKRFGHKNMLRGNAVQIGNSPAAVCPKRLILI